MYVKEPYITDKIGVQRQYPCEVSCFSHVELLPPQGRTWPFNDKLFLLIANAAHFLIGIIQYLGLIRSQHERFPALQLFIMRL